MSTVLQLNASIYSSAGQSSQLAESLVTTWLETHPKSRVIVRDLATKSVPHLTAERFQALQTPLAERTAEQQAVVDFSDELIAELQAADAIVIALPMYNFGIPSELKAYFDHIARAGVTFRYTSAGPEGLFANKQVYVVATRGGVYAGTAADTESQYLKQFLSFIGLSNVEFIYAEGLATAQRETSLKQARQQIKELLRPVWSGVEKATAAA
jgi:FMN-dependent NADH-azoreductase